jgi:type IV pilus assembly protein PilY1
MFNSLVSRFRFAVLSVSALLLSVASIPPASAGMTDYCQVPPYVIQNVPPNIMILQDISGSTLNFAYEDGFDPNYVTAAGNRGYYGYFDVNYWYTYGSNKFTRSRIKRYVASDNTVVVNAKTNAEWDGNFLNWLIMRRADIIRKVLTGGRVSGTVIDCEQPDGAGRGITKTIANAGLYTGINKNEARTFTFSTSGTFTMSTTDASNKAISFRPQLDVPTPVEGVLQDVIGARARLGLTMFKENEGGNVIVNIAASNLSSAVNQINLTHTATNTPLAEALWSVTGYFAQQDTLPPYSGGPGPKYSNGDYTVNANADAMNFGSGGSARYPVCQKSFVLLITDGEPCSDGNLPAAVRSYAATKGSPFDCINQDCPAVTQGSASFPAFDLSTVSCSGTGGLSTHGNEAGLEDVALFAHTTDLRNRGGSPNVGIDNIAGLQNLTLYVVQAFGSGSAVLQYAAINGGFEDNGSGYPTSQSTWDKDGNGIPDNYYGADDGWALERAIREALSSILKRASSGTAASVLASGEGSGANLLQAIFYPRRRFGNEVIGWTGSLQNLWYYVDPFFTNANIREETTVDGKLNLTNDYISQFYYDTATETTKVHRYSDPDGNGSPNAAIDNVAFEYMSSLWEAGRILHARDLSANPRDIKTNLDGASTFTAFTEDAATTLAPYMLQSADNALKTIRYVHGYDDDTLLNRPRTVTAFGVDNGVWKLGDVVDSTPRVVSGIQLNKYDSAYQDSTYKAFITDNAYKNRGMAFVGGNDGMLHAFKMGKLDLHWTGQGAFEKAKMTNLNNSIPLGTEMWSFIPKNALPYLKYMMDNEYCHLYYVDLAPYVFDASIGGDSTDLRTQADWRTVLIGGMRFGGACANVCASGSDCVKTPATDSGYSSYFALDVTNPDDPRFMWEFTSPQLGFATTGPSVVRINGLIPSTTTRDKNRNGEWYVVFGSGPTGPIDNTSMQFLGRSNQNLRYFVLNLKTGAVEQTIDTGIANAFGGSMINTVADVDLDYQDDAIYTGFTKRVGSSAPYSWTGGGIGRILTKETTPTNGSGGWAFSKVIDDVGPVTTAVSRLQNNVYHNEWLYFGTGRFFFAQPPEGSNSTPVIDDADNQRRLIAVKEPCFTDQNLLNPTCTTTLTFPSTADTNFPNVSNVANAPTDDLANSTAFKGWYINLDPTNYYTYDNVSQYFRAERVITDPLASTSGMVFFTTFKPYGQECGLGGKSFIWALKYNTGGAPAQGVIKGKALVQVSTASVEQIDMSSAFRPATGEPADGLHKGGRRSASIEGVPPTAQGLSLLLPPPPVNRVLHMKER